MKNSCDSIKPTTVLSKILYYNVLMEIVVLTLLTPALVRIAQRLLKLSSSPLMLGRLLPDKIHLFHFIFSSF